MNTTSPVVTSSDTASQGEPLVRIYNKSERAFLLDDIDPATFKATTHWKIAGRGFSKVPQRVAEKVMRMFPNDVVGDEEGLAVLRGAQARVDQLETENAELKARILLLSKDPSKAADAKDAVIADLNKQIADLRDLIDKATKPTPVDSPL